MKKTKNKTLAISKKTYFLFLVFVFFVTGTMLLFYFMLEGLNPFNAEASSCPFFYYGLCFVCFCFYYRELTEGVGIWFKVFCIMVLVFVGFLLYLFMFSYMGYF